MKHPPYSRGVQHLMYVSGDEVAPAAAPAPTGLAALSTAEKIGGAVGLLAAIGGEGLTRLIGIGAASWIGYKAFGKRT